jgi:hypothetical protein
LFFIILLFIIMGPVFLLLFFTGPSVTSLSFFFPKFRFAVRKKEEEEEEGIRGVQLGLIQY